MCANVIKMVIQKSTTTKNIIESGSVFTFKREPLRIKFNEELDLEFNFITDQEKGNKIETEVGKDGKYLKIILYNAKGIGSTTEPLFIAQDDKNNKQTHLSFAFSESGDSFLCHYTIFQTRD